MKAFIKDHGYFYYDNFKENFWSKVKTSTVWELLSGVGGDDQKPFTGVYDHMRGEATCPPEGSGCNMLDDD